MRKSKSRRHKDQQAKYRREQKLLRRPNRDDVARVAFHWLVINAHLLAERTKNKRRMHVVEDAILDKLIAQGFDSNASEDVLERLISKYVDGWDFQRKPYLIVQEDAE